MTDNHFYGRKRDTRSDLAQTDFTLLTPPVAIDRRALEPARARRDDLQLTAWQRLVEGLRRAVFR